jgi:hypothetical protein
MAEFVEEGNSRERETDLRLSLEDGRANRLRFMENIFTFLFIYLFSFFREREKLMERLCCWNERCAAHSTQFPHSKNALSFQAPTIINYLII